MAVLNDLYFNMMMYLGCHVVDVFCCFLFVVFFVVVVVVFFVGMVEFTTWLCCI